MYIKYTENEKYLVYKLIKGQTKKLNLKINLLCIYYKVFINNQEFLCLIVG